MPFQESPSHQQGYRDSGGGRRTTNKFVYQKKGDRLNRKEKVSVITSPFLHNLEFPLLIPDSDLQNVHPFIKKSIPGNKNTSDSSSRKTKILSKVLGKINQRPKDIGQYTRVSDTLQKKTLPKIKNSEGDRHVQGSEDYGKPGDFRYIEKKAIRECQPHPNQFVSTLFLVSQEGWGQSSCDKLKKIEQVDPLSTLQDGSFALCEVHVAARRLHVQIRHEGCLLFVSLTQKLQGQSSFSMVREALRIPLSVFWLRTSPKNFYQKVPISLIRRLNIRIVIYLDDMLLLGRSIKEVLIATDTAIFLLQHLGFAVNLKNSILIPQQKIEFLGLLLDSLNMSLSFSPGKLMKVNSQCLEM